MQIVIVAGEASGDLLAAGLMRALKSLFPTARFSGIGGDKMQAEGFDSLYAMDRLSVMGIIEPLKRLPELLKIQRHLKHHCLNVKADLVIGVDSPDFTLSIEKFAKSHGIKTVHYVSPSVWAWRQGRIKGIKQAVDLMLCLLPFEVDFYRQHQQNALFVGHPLADEISLHCDSLAAKAALGIEAQQRVLTLMPGSRHNEVALMGEVFLQVAQAIGQHASLQLVIPAANAARKQQLEELLASHRDLSVKLLHGQSHLALAASDAVLLTSGTTALEAMLFKKPMVVAYKTSPLSYAILARLVKTPFIALPNLLAGEALVPELIQEQANPANLQQAVEKALFDEPYREQQIKRFYQLHQFIQADASAVAAKAIGELLEQPC